MVAQGEEEQMSTSSTLVEMTPLVMMTDQLEVTEIVIVVNGGNAVGNVTEKRNAENDGVPAPERDAGAPGLVNASGPLQVTRLGAPADDERGKEIELEQEPQLEKAEREVETAIEIETARGGAGAGIGRETGKEERVQKEGRKSWAG